MKSYSCMCIFFQLRWKPFEIPKASQKKVDFVSVSKRCPHLPTAPSLFRCERPSHLRAECQAEAASEAGSRHSTICLCFRHCPLMSYLPAPSPPTPKGTRGLFTTSPNSQWKLSFYLPRFLCFGEQRLLW